MGDLEISLSSQDQHLFDEMQVIVDQEIDELPQRINRRTMLRNVVFGSVAALSIPILGSMAYAGGCTCDTPGANNCNYSPVCTEVTAECNGGSPNTGCMAKDACTGKDACAGKDACTVTFENKPSGGE